MNKKEIEEILDSEDAVQSVLLEPKIDALMEILDIETPPDTPLKKAPSEEEIRKDLRKVISDTAYNRDERRRNLIGFQLLIENLDTVPNADQCRQELKAASQQLGEYLLEEIAGSEEKAEATRKALDELYEEAHQEIVFEEQAAEEKEILDLSHAVPLTEFLNISDEVFTSLYKIGVELFKKNEIEEAAAVFQFLSYLNILCHETWYSQGLCFQKLEKWPEAITNYSFAILTNCFNIHTYLNLAECYLATNDTENFTKTLSLAEGILEDSGMEDKEREACQELINELKSKA